MRAWVHAFSNPHFTSHTGIKSHRIRVHATPCEKVGHCLRTQELARAYKFERWGTVQFIFILFSFFRLLENFFSADILTDIRG